MRLSFWRIRFALILVFVVCVSCRQHEERQEPSKSVESPEEANERLIASVQRSVEELASRHNALRDWAGIQTKGNDDQVFTLEVQDALERLDGRPIVFVSTVRDIFKVNEGYRLLCHYAPRDELPLYSANDSSWDALATVSTVTFLLEVDEVTARQIVETLRKSEDDWYIPQFFAIAILPRQTQVILSWEEYAVGEIIEEGEYQESRQAEVEIQDGVLSPRVLITGQCLEIVHLEGYLGF